MADRIQKVLAQAGVGSRREIDRWLTDGRISVDGKTAKPGDRLSRGQAVTVDGEPVVLSRRQGRERILLYNKPPGQIVTRSDTHDRPTVFDALPVLENGRWIAVGRLDIATTGLLIFTTNGDLAHGLMHPSRELKREYLVRIHGAPDRDVIRRLRKGVKLDDGPAKFDTLERLRKSTASNAWYRVAVHEGRNRIVRRLWEAVGFRVNRLMRTQFGPVGLPRKLGAGEFAEADASMRKALHEAGKLNA